MNQSIMPSNEASVKALDSEFERASQLAILIVAARRRCHPQPHGELRSHGIVGASALEPLLDSALCISPLG